MNGIMNRRNFLTASALAAAAPGLSQTSPKAALKRDIKLAVATYSLRKFDRPQAIQMIKACGVKYVNLKEFHLRYKTTSEERAAGRKEFADAGLEIVAGGNITIKENTDDEVEFYFKYAKECGIKAMVMAPTHDNLGRIEKFAKKYDIRTAIHNHGPEDKLYPAPQDAYKLIRNMDPRMGLCVDIGHSVRAGVDLLKTINEVYDRTYDIHVKDLMNFTQANSQVEVGDGNLPVAEMFKLLAAKNYPYTVSLEYEIKADDPLPGMIKSFAYMRGVIAGLNA